ncbi:MAG: hypothetical protein GC204_16750, partial [Chloroflexi bacterium]|nr:hypothetical protein [Chloroflexota bacterium]
YRTATQLNQNPAKVRINTAYTQNGSDLTLTGNTFISYIFNALYSTWLIPSLPLIIDQVANGNYTQMSQVASDKFYTDSTMSLGLYLSIECSDEMPFNTLKATVDAEESVPLGAFYLRSMSATNSNAPDGCTAWGTPNPDPIENEPVASNVPVLIFNGEFDPITPPSWGELAAQTLPNSRVITFPGVGHGASFSGSACAVEIAAAFFSNPNAPSDASCLGNTPVHWVTLDLSTSLLAVEAKIDATDNWYSTYKQSNLYWNTERWSANDYFGTLVITDYQPVAFPKVDQSWFDHLFGNWGKYVLQKQCQRGSYSLYEFSVISSNDTIYIVRYWVDRSSPDKIRDMVLSLAQSDLIDLASNSLKLVPELPNC